MLCTNNQLGVARIYLILDLILDFTKGYWHIGFPCLRYLLPCIWVIPNYHPLVGLFGAPESFQHPIDRILCMHNANSDDNFL